MHAYSKTLKKGDPASPPIVSTSKFKLPGTPEADYVYGRYGNPTVEAVEAAISSLEGAPALAFPSGMAAATAVLMTMTQPGDRILLPSDGYFTIRALLDAFIAQQGIHVDTVATADMGQADLAPYRMVWLETPSNPGLRTCDIQAISKICRAHSTKLVVDNTTLTPLLQPALDLGADIVLSSDTKAMSGHSDALFGHIASRDEALMSKAREWRKLSGSIPGPFEAFLVHRGLMTLELRLARMCDNAVALSQLLKNAAGVRDVRYPGTGFVLAATFANAASADAFLADCPAIFPSTSFGGVHTSAERRERWGDDVAPGFLRISAGCEPTQPLLETVKAALRRTVQ